MIAINDIDSFDNCTDEEQQTQPANSYLDKALLMPSNFSIDEELMNDFLGMNPEKALK